MKWLKYVAWRLIASFIIVGLLVYLFIFRPHQQAVSGMNEHIQVINTAIQAFEKMPVRLKTLPQPESIKPGNKQSAHKHSQALKESIPAFDIKLTNDINPYSLIWKDGRVDMFNRFIEDGQNKKMLSQIQLTARSSYNLVAHHTEVMDALDNLLDYDPSKDTNSSDPEVVHSRMEAAQGGLDRTIKRIKDATNPLDPSLGGVEDSIKAVENARLKYHQAVGAGRLDGPERKRFVSVVSAAQTSIIANRQKFWMAAQFKEQAVVNTVYKSLGPLRQDLAKF
jgi:hypothetical protein